ncbi:hypothetical protein [Streptomyces sp. cg35]|uniref:hypothetical protein n=1 Tax=Streptomyces sp. cg35 TaxID=3421650 RepID=UPI003D179E31
MQYISALTELTSEDARHVTTYMTVSLTAVVITLTQLPFERLLGMPLAMRTVLVVGIVVALSGSALFFRYVQGVHRARIAITRCLASGNARRAYELWTGQQGVWAKGGKAYTWGARLTLCGHALVAFTVVYLLLHGK